MKSLITRISKGSVKVKSDVVASCGPGIGVFVAIEKGDSPDTLATLAEKIINLRIFENDAGKMQFSVKDTSNEILLIPNFTLSADTEAGRRPSFDNAMPPDEAKKIFGDLVSYIQAQGLKVSYGEFGAHMDVALTMDGPVNILISV